MDKDIDKIILTWESNLEKYKGKSAAWCLRITADEIGMRSDDLCIMLDRYYEEHDEIE